MLEIIDETALTIPIPAVVTTGGRAPKYPFRDMGVGDIKRFIVDAEEVRRIQRAAAAFSRRNNVKLVTRRLDDGVRIWRVE